MTNEPELIGGVLYDAENPIEAARELATLLTSGTGVSPGAGQLKVDPLLLKSLKKRLSEDPKLVEASCLAGAAWVLGRRSVVQQDKWEVVASLPSSAEPVVGLRRETAETLVGLAAAAKNYLRFTAPFIDQKGLAYLSDAIVAATKRDVSVELIYHESWPPAEKAVRVLLEAVTEEGNTSNIKLSSINRDAPFAHLKVMLVDGSAAYIGSANLTGAGLGGENLELGVLVTGRQVETINAILNSCVS